MRSARRATARTFGLAAAMAAPADGEYVKLIGSRWA
jgi:hypothetical protein